MLTTKNLLSSVLWLIAAAVPASAMQRPALQCRGSNGLALRGEPELGRSTLFGTITVALTQAGSDLVRVHLLLNDSAALDCGLRGRGFGLRIAGNAATAWNRIPGSLTVNDPSAALACSSAFITFATGVQFVAGSFRDSTLVVESAGVAPVELTSTVHALSPTDWRTTLFPRNGNLGFLIELNSECHVTRVEQVRSPPARALDSSRASAERP